MIINKHILHSKFHTFPLDVLSMGSTLTLGLWNLWSPCVPYPAHILYPEVSTRAVDVLQAEVNICANPLHGLDFQAATHVLGIGPWGWQTKSKTVGWYIHNYIEEEWWDWQKKCNSSNCAVVFWTKRGQSCNVWLKSTLTACMFSSMKKKIVS